MMSEKLPKKFWSIKKKSFLPAGTLLLSQLVEGGNQKCRLNMRSSKTNLAKTNQNAIEAAKIPLSTQEDFREHNVIRLWCRN